MTHTTASCHVFRKAISYQPLSDDLRGKKYHHDGIHFSKAGLEALAERWFEVLNKQYGTSKD